VQCIMFANKSIPKECIKYIEGLPTESIVDVRGVVSVAPSPVLSATQSLVELHMEEVHAVNRPTNMLPFQVIDAARQIPAEEAGDQEDKAASTVEEDGKDGWVGSTVKLNTKLDHRWIDLRTPANQAIFRIQSGVCESFRNFLSKRGFVEIHSPKLLGGASEGGANVFNLEYFGSPACLAQSPQLYKQMAAACGGFERVYEIGPVFRAENSNTHRHLCEFTGLDFEMVIKEHYYEVLEVFGELFISIFDHLNSKYAKELESVAQQFPFEPLQYCRPSLRLHYYEGIKLLQEAGYNGSSFPLVKPFLALLHLTSDLPSIPSLSRSGR
jgi:aspartyl/asparaginyl-tRNA synthetase